MARDNVQIVELAARPTSAIRAQVPVQDMPAAFGELLAIVGAETEKRGALLVGVPYMLYRGMADGIFDVEIGMPLSERVAGLPAIDSIAYRQVGSSELPGGRAVVWLYIGPYSELGTAWGEFNAWMADHGYEGNASWESYVDRPDLVSPTQLQTELYWSLA